MMKLMAMEGVYVVDLVYCSYGAKWMKPTRLLTNVKQLLELACSCTQDHDHIMLRGRAPSGEFWTALACAYPPLLCKAYTRGVQEAIRAERLDTRPRVFGGVASSADHAGARLWIRPGQNLDGGS